MNKKREKEGEKKEEEKEKIFKERPWQGATQAHTLFIPAQQSELLQLVCE